MNKVPSLLLFHGCLTYAEQTQLISDLRSQDTNSNDLFKVPFILSKLGTNRVVDMLRYSKSYSNVNIHCLPFADIGLGNYRACIDCIHSLFSSFETELLTLE